MKLYTIMPKVITTLDMRKHIPLYYEVVRTGRYIIKFNLVKEYSYFKIRNL